VADSDLGSEVEYDADLVERPFYGADVADVTDDVLSLGVEVPVPRARLASRAVENPYWVPRGEQGVDQV
jgi:hypothetical protein